MRNEANPPSQGERAYQVLRENIIFGRYRPNQRLVEVELSAELDVSRTPIREALGRLATEGLVESRRRGWIVHEHSADEVRHIYQVRAALEGFAARLAAEQATAQEVEDLAAIYGEGIPTLLEGPRSKLVPLNGVFHRGINALARNPRLSALCAANQSFAFNVQLAATYSHDEMAESLLMHTRILDAVRRHDGDAAEMLTREHILSALDIVLRRLDQRF